MTLREHIDRRRVIVCAGSGGVGKTTVATALALSAARAGRRVLALTVDPSKRLAETMGVDRNLTVPVPVPAERLAEAGVAAGRLDAWMLDPRIVADDFVRRVTGSSTEADRLIANRIYRQMSRMVAGMQEYMAMEALYTFQREGRYDLIVLDTPPSRHALDFLYGPGRVASFVNSRIFGLFLPGERANVIRRAATRLVREVNSAVFGRENYQELEEFFASFSGVLASMSASATEGLDRLRDREKVAFLLVTTPASEALQDAFFFRKKTLELGLPFRGFVLNKSHAADDRRALPSKELFGKKPTAVEKRALAKLQDLARLEQAEVARDRALLEELEREAGEGALALALPRIAGGAEEMKSLSDLGAVLYAS